MFLKAADPTFTKEFEIVQRFIKNANVTVELENIDYVFSWRNPSDISRVAPVSFFVDCITATRSFSQFASLILIFS